MPEAEESSVGHFRFDPRLLDHFSVAMYKDAKRAISELVANSYDANATEVKVTIPDDWSRSGAKIVVEDDGDGMLPQDIRDRFLLLGYNKRASNDGAADKGARSLIGSKGIGKLAGLGLARDMHYTTTKKGRTSVFVIAREMFSDPRKSLEQYDISISTSRLGKSNGTRVELYPLNRDITPIGDTELRQSLANEYASISGFEIFVNDRPATVEILKGKYFDIDEKVEGFGPVKGWYKVLDQPILNPGFSVRVRGRTVKSRTTFDIGPQASRAINYAYIIGDVEANFLDPQDPKTVLDQFTIATDRDGFNEASPAYQAFKKWAETRLKRIAKTVKETRDGKAKDKIGKSPAIKRTLSKLPPRVRESAQVTMSRLVTETTWESEKEIFELAKAFAETCSSSEAVLILKELSSASADDIKGFAALLGQYGFADLWRLSDHVATRLELMDQFERLIQKERTLELSDIHPIIDSNIWLISDDYMMLTSNQQIRTLLLKELGYEDKAADKRPDFICRRFKKSLVIVELKRANYRLTPEDLAQVFTYIDLLKKHYPNHKMEATLIGGSCDTSSQATHGNIPITLTTYRELIEDAKDRYKEFIRILRKSGD